MSGIAGIFDLDGGGIDPAETLPRMLAALAHRGPDAQTQHCFTGGGLDCVTVAIGDPDAARDPVLVFDGGAFTIVFDGAIFNAPSLRRELEAAGRRFQTRSDAEVILRAYQQWGAESANRLNGDWAFALFDRRQRRLFGSRDRSVSRRKASTERRRVFIARDASRRDQEPQRFPMWPVFGMYRRPATLPRRAEASNRPKPLRPLRSCAWSPRRWAGSSVPGSP